MRLSPEYIREAVKHVSSQAWIPLVKVEHIEWDAPLLYARSAEPVSRPDGIYQPAAFDLSMADENDNDTPELMWRTGAVERELVRRLRTYRKGFTVTVTWLLSSDLDGEGYSFKLRLGRWVIKRTTIEGTLTIRQVLNRPASAIRFSQSNFPGVY